MNTITKSTSIHKLTVAVKKVKESNCKNNESKKVKKYIHKKYFKWR